MMAIRRRSLGVGCLGASAAAASIARSALVSAFEYDPRIHRSSIANTSSSRRASTCSKSAAARLVCRSICFLRSDSSGNSAMADARSLFAVATVDCCARSTRSTASRYRASRSSTAAGTSGNGVVTVSAQNASSSTSSVYERALGDASVLGRSTRPPRRIPSTSYVE